MVRDTKESGMKRQTRGMEEGTKFGLTVHFTKATGRMIKQMEGAGLSTRMGMFMKVNGKTIKLMG